MPTRDEADLKERADRALRAGRAQEAVNLYGALLAKVAVFEPGLYESWLDGALSAYQALGNGQAAAYVLLGLRRFSEAEKRLDPAAQPVPWALAVSRLGRGQQAARTLARAGYLAFAASELERTSDLSGAAELWERVTHDPRLRGRDYERALAAFCRGRVLRRLGDGAAARRAFREAQLGLEGLADRFEGAGQRERAFDCYGLLLQIGRETGAFENLAEGYLNAIRVLAADDQRLAVVSYYDEFLDEAVQRGEWHAAAETAREAAAFSARRGLAYEAHYLARAADLWMRAASAAEQQGLAPELGESALVNALDAATSMGDLGGVARAYAALAALPGTGETSARYQALAKKYSHAADLPRPATAHLPDVLRRTEAAQDIARQDLVEWELQGDPRAVLAQILVERTDHIRFSRLALQGLLWLESPPYRAGNDKAVADLALALGRVQVYEVLRPLERLHAEGSAAVRAAVMRAAGQVFCRRSFGLVRAGLQDDEVRVRDEALRALRALRFRDGLDPLVSLYRSSNDPAVRATVVDTVADIGSSEAALFLLEVARQEPSPLREQAARRLRTVAGQDVAAVVREAAATADPELRALLAGPTQSPSPF